MARGPEEYIGYAGAFFLSLVLIPQVVKTVRERSDHSSALFLLLEILASTCFILYGYMLGSEGLPVVVSNASALLYTIMSSSTRYANIPEGGAGGGRLSLPSLLAPAENLLDGFPRVERVKVFYSKYIYKIIIQDAC